MNKEFILYEQALALKELGFDEETICVYNSYKQLKGVIISSVDGDYIKKDKWDDRLPAPTFSQAFRWFRKKYELVIEPCVPFQRLYSTEDDHFEILEFGYRIYSFDQFRGGLRDKIEWYGYDNSNEGEAELECLKKLIEIVNEKHTRNTNK